MPLVDPLLDPTDRLGAGNLSSTSAFTQTARASTVRPAERAQRKCGCQGSRALTTELIEQLQGRLLTPREERIGELAVRQRPGELQGADHQAEDRERVRSSAVDVGLVGARRDASTTPMTSAVKTSLVSVARRAIASSRAAEGHIPVPTLRIADFEGLFDL
jgi:hypothetical protein